MKYLLRLAILFPMLLTANWSVDVFADYEDLGVTISNTGPMGCKIQNTRFTVEMPVSSDFVDVEHYGCYLKHNGKKYKLDVIDIWGDNISEGVYWTFSHIKGAPPLSCLKDIALDEPTYHLLEKDIGFFRFFPSMKLKILDDDPWLLYPEIQEIRIVKTMSDIYILSVIYPADRECPIEWQTYEDSLNISLLK